MSIQFTVIDKVCEALDLSFFQMQVKLTTVSTTKFITWFGYSEFIPSTPPKKYHNITFDGSSQRIGFTAEETPRQCAGAKYVYSGVGNIDAAGKQVTTYKKDFYAQCAKKFWPPEPLQTVPGAITTGGAFPQFIGYCWPTDPASCPVCNADATTWPFLGNYSLNAPTADLAAFIHIPSDPVVTHTTWNIDSVFTALTSINRNAPYKATATGNKYDVMVGIDVYHAQSVVTDPALLTFPVVSIGGVVGEFIVFTDTNKYSAVLSDEYTDAEALANAKVVVGTGATAANLPRTTGFTTVTTTVDFTLSCIDLIIGNHYLATVDFWDQVPSTGASVHTTQSYDFIATSTTHTIVDSVPTPAAGHITTVRKPTISLIV